MIENLEMENNESIHECIHSFYNTDPVLVRLMAAVDNLKEAEGLELAPWY